MAATEKAIWFIESHSTEALSLGQVAAVAGVSPFHLSRLFQAATGWPVMRYLRARRLTEAARRLADGADDILAVALACGYGSHEAFTRAFGEQFGIAPAALRERGTLGGLDLCEVCRIDGEADVALAPPRLARDGTRFIAGIGRHYTPATVQGIPSQWQALAPLAGAWARGRTAFGVCCNGDDEGNFEYVAGFDVPGFGGLPAQLRTLRLPAREYAVATHRGHISSIRQTWSAFLGDWLPRSGLRVADAPDFEKYSEDFDDRRGTGDVEIWVPLESPT